MLVACARNPATGQRQLALISESQEIQMGREAAQQAQRSIGLVQDDALQEYVHRVGTSLAALSERPNLPWTFRVVDDPTPNAFALPGGFIFITRGLLTYMDSEAELASVLGHEIAHVTARHGVQQISRAQLAQLGLGLGMILVPEIQQFQGLLGTGLQLLFLKHGRDAEREADKLGFGYALEGGFDVREMGDIFATLQQIAETEGRSPLPAWASTHPDPGARIAAVEKRVAALEVPLDDKRLGREDFLNRIDGLIFGNNPRQGFFENNVFLHPDLAFRIEFPEGWRTQNLPQAVLAGAPEQDAVMQLTLAPGTPEEAMQRFISQEGVRTSTPSRERINSLPALLTQFAAQTQQGTIQGVVALIRHGDATYEIVGFTPAGRYAGRERAFLQTIGSFAPVDDPRVLNVRPRRIDVVELPKPMSLSEFARGDDGEVDLDTFALINQVDDVNARLPAGHLLKRIVSE